MAVKHGVAVRADRDEIVDRVQLVFGVGCGMMRRSRPVESNGPAQAYFESAEPRRSR